MGKMSERATTLQTGSEVHYNTEGCPACGERGFTVLRNLVGIMQCIACEGYYGQTTEEAAAVLVANRWAQAPYNIAEQRYYDLCYNTYRGLDREERVRVHGWFLPATGAITQVG